MKLLNLLPLLSLVFILTACGDTAQESTGEEESSFIDVEKLQAATPATDRVEVIDFYGTHRCVTCKSIEANTRYTLATFFPEELKSGKITFRTVNVDEPENAEIAESFEATGTALFLNVVKGGQETHVDLTEQAFEKGRERDALAEDLKFFINLQLQEI